MNYNINTDWSINIDNVLKDIITARKILNVKPVKIKTNINYQNNFITTEQIPETKKLQYDSDLNQGLLIKDPHMPLIDINGNCRFLYIPNNTWKPYHEYIGSDDLKKIHITYCNVLQDMENKGDFHKYVFTRNTSGTYTVIFRQNKQERRKLQICKVCLKEMSKHKIDQYGSKEDFDFQTFAMDFKHPESFNNANYIKIRYDYPVNWGEISYNYRESVGWKCEECGYDASDDKRGLHTHHINMDKSNSHAANLQALCISCHEKKHPHMQDH